VCRPTAGADGDAGPSHDFTVLGTSANGECCGPLCSQKHSHPHFAYPRAQTQPVTPVRPTSPPAAVYTVRICIGPRCTCPDFEKGNLCKHIMFVMMRVLRQKPDCPLIWQVSRAGFP
jgi:hypothetical protein